MGALQERITSTKTGSITSVQAIYVPADDLTDPAPATTFAHLFSAAPRILIFVICEMFKVFAALPLAVKTASAIRIEHFKLFPSFVSFHFPRHRLFPVSAVLQCIQIHRFKFNFVKAVSHSLNFKYISYHVYEIVR